jgi:hypothetical protein
LFPSVFLTRKLNEAGDQMQLAYTRRVNRPNFFQTMPFTDFSDSLNLRRGNVQLLPEFTNSLELSYQKIFQKRPQFARVGVLQTSLQPDNLLPIHRVQRRPRQRGSGDEFCQRQQCRRLWRRVDDEKQFLPIGST